MWADSKETMVIPGPKRATELVNGNAYWMSSATLGLVHVQLKWHNDDMALVFAKDDYYQVRMADTAFYTEKPR